MVRYPCRAHVKERVYDSQDEALDALIESEVGAGHSQKEAEKRARQIKIVQCAGCQMWYAKTL